ncbi:thioesterase family protein [Promethearchaeum syntrophicum]|uniref:Thioesterase family protein n=1 Tax=Promethearchaeum syntrophicum TaxID=2594042 RepID=A0A5B9D7N6_9ARCH|nr:thioesterase family protein [Candidatus Prometheoarchaeum syntrophicum]
MIQIYEKVLYAGWADMDFNGHMANRAFLDKSGDVRMMFFSENGLSGRNMAKMRIGPVIKSDKLEYFLEIGLMEEIKCTLILVGTSKDGSRFKICNEFKKMNGSLAARVTSVGGWLDLKSRKLIAPPDLVLKMMDKLHKTEDFEQLPSSIRKTP